MELSAENIGSNWNYFISLIELTISGERKNKLIEFYQERANRIALAPYSSRTSDVNCFAGG
jgi:predicted AAA+ superfamily ATPase